MVKSKTAEGSENVSEPVTLSEAKGLCYRTRGIFADDQNDIMMRRAFVNTLRRQGRAQKSLAKAAGLWYNDTAFKSSALPLGQPPTIQ
jgi:hypothetical protein